VSDVIDQANDRAQQFLEHSLGNINKAQRLKPCGLCYNCEEKLKAEQTFCDSDCRDDWQRRNPSK
jgi:hypothetical protein